MFLFRAVAIKKEAFGMAVGSFTDDFAFFFACFFFFRQAVRLHSQAAATLQTSASHTQPQLFQLQKLPKVSCLGSLSWGDWPPPTPHPNRKATVTVVWSLAGAVGEFSSPELTLCADLFTVHSTPCVTAMACQRPWSFWKVQMAGYT